jgi:hypothetical protein
MISLNLCLLLSLCLSFGLDASSPTLDGRPIKGESGTFNGQDCPGEQGATRCRLPVGQGTKTANAGQHGSSVGRAFSTGAQAFNHHTRPSDISLRQGRKILFVAKKHLGIAYGMKVGQMVCNVLVWRSIREAGFKSVPYISTFSIARCPFFRRIPPAQLRAGDIVVFAGRKRHAHMGVWDPHPPGGGRSGYKVLSATTSKGVRYGAPKWFGAPIACYRLQEL